MANKVGRSSQPEAREPAAVAQESGELYRLLVESVEDYAIFALDPDGYILSWNAGAERFKGYTADEAIGRHFSMFYLPERIAEGFPEFELREAARLGRFEDEGWRVRQDGTRFWANVVITALRNSDGNLLGYAKVTRDLTQRRAAEEELRISEQRFRLLVQGVKDYAIYMLDSAGYVATWNDGAERIKGYSADEIIGQHFSKFYPGEEVAAGEPARELEIAAREGQYEKEGWRLRKDGSQLWASILITAIRGADGQLLGFAKVTRDLSERRASQERAMADGRRVAAEEAARQAADEARERSERLQSLTAALSAAHSIPEIASIVFGDGFRAVDADAGALAFVDAEDARIRIVDSRGYTDLPAWVGDVGVDEDLPVSVAVRTGRLVVCRSRAERDERFPRLSTVLQSFDAGVAIPLAARGRPIGALTMHRRAGHPLSDADLEFMYSLAQQVGQAFERAQLSEAEQSARVRADEANLAKSVFLTAMSHELRTPLNAIAGYADLIDMGLRGPVTVEQRDDLRRIKRSQQHLLGIINDILNFSRLEAGQTTYHYAMVVSSDVLESVRLMIGPQAAAKGLAFTVKTCPANVAVWADQAKLEQILLNLLSNAVKFTNEGSVTLYCNGAASDHLEFSVGDTGGGIPSEHAERIFEPFVQIGRSLFNPGEGTGLGLAISRDLARAMGGEITVKSEVGVGSTFTLTLPRSPSASGRAVAIPPR